MKKVRKMLPVSLYDISGIEKWLEDQADNGLFPFSIGRCATFTTDGVPGTRFRLEPYGACGKTPTEEQLTLYRNAGWEYASSVGSMYFLFYTADPAAVELYSDHESRGLSLERLEKALWRARRRMIAIYPVLATVIWLLVFRNDKFDVQPNHLAYLPLIVLRLFHPVLLLFVIGQIFLAFKNCRDVKLLQKTCKALKEGMAPPPSPGPDKKIALENLVSIAVSILLIILVLGQCYDWFSLDNGKCIPLDRCNHPYVKIQDIEQTPICQWSDLFEQAPRDSSGIYYANMEHSLLAPVWYSVTQEAYSPQDGTSSAFSTDPENGANRYSPQLEMTYFQLLIPSMARSVAEAQMNDYRLINLHWSCESVDYPGLDFVITSDEPDGIWQIIALGKGGKAAVFRYGGQEDLREHLEVLAALVK